MYRYKVILEYLGTGLVGMQRQNTGLSIQQIIEEALFNFCGEKVNFFFCGRTDAGVHAIAMPGHFDLHKYYDSQIVLNALNAHILNYLRAHTNISKLYCYKQKLKPKNTSSKIHVNIGIISCESVDSEFHARYSAKKRHYIYKITNRISAPIFLESGKSWWIDEKLNLSEMINASNYIIGTHDFTSFRSTKCQAKSPIKTLDEIEITQSGEEIIIKVSAPSFLHNMVRNIVGVLVDVGLGNFPASRVKDILNDKNRKVASATAPACGLYFLKADY